MGLFTRKKKTVEPINYDTKVFQSTLNIFSDFGNNINASDVVKICIDRIASHAAKLKPRYVKSLDNSSVVEKKGTLAYLLKYQPNPLMTPYDFIYRTVTLLYIKDASGDLFLRFSFIDGRNYTLPYESIIHVRRFYGINDIFGGSGAISDHSAILKTIKINDSVLQGIDNAIRSSFQIKGLLKINGMLSEKDKKAQKDEFDRALKEATLNGNSSIVPVDLKSDYVPLSVDPKLVSSETLTFLQKKIITYFGVSESIYDNKYTEDEYNAFYEGTIEGIAIAFSETFSKALLTRNNLENGEQIVFYSERLQYASWNTKVSAIEKLMGLGILSLNESRSLLGLEPIEGGDKRLQSLNYVDANNANKYQVGEEPKEEQDVNK
jgi:HK97 family phage portal protein